MENRKGALRAGRAANFQAPLAVFRSALPAFLAILLIGGCAAPGDPYARNSLVPQPVADLTASQSGDDVVLTFTLPKEAVDHRPLEQPPAIEIYRDFQQSSGPGQAPPSKPTLLVTIPAATEDRYTEQGHIRYTDSLHADDFTSYPNTLAVYVVRTFVSEKKLSANSAAASVPIHPVPDLVDDVKAEVTHSAIVLTWTAPRTSFGGPPPPISGYAVYRAEVEPGNPSAPAASAIDLKLKSPLAKIGETPTTTYQDEQFDFGGTYVYSVRSITQYPSAALESAGSKLTVVEARDTFPPDTPQGLVVVLVPAQSQAAARLELSWAISPEPDIAGYNVYRSEQAGAPGTRVNTDLLPTPAFRDMNVLPGRRYSYTVTAVDRSGNESPASESVSGGVPAESRSTP